MVHMIRHKLLDFSLSFSTFCIAEELSKIDGVDANGIFVNMYQFGTLQIVEKFFLSKQIHEDFFK
jgi:hypothetical protein